MSRIHVQGELRADKIEYHDGVGCCIWYPLKDPLDTDENSEGENIGLCFDFPESDIPDMIKLLQTLQDAEPDEFDGSDADDAFLGSLKG